MLEGRMGGREGGSEYEGLVYDAEGGELQRDLIRADVVWYNNMRRQNSFVPM